MTLGLRVDAKGPSSQLDKFDVEKSEGRSSGATMMTMADLDKMPCAKLKVDELMFKFLANEANQAVVKGLVADYEAGLELPETGTNLAVSSPVMSPRRFSNAMQAFSPPRSPRSPRPRSLSSPRSPPKSPRSFGGPLSPRRSLSTGAGPHAAAAAKQVVNAGIPCIGRTKQPEIIPTFYGPSCKKDFAQISRKELDSYFEEYEGSGGVPLNEFVTICKDVLGFPTFFNGPLCQRIVHCWKVHNKSNTNDDDDDDDNKSKNGKTGNKSTGMEDVENIIITKSQFLHFWETEIVPYDELDRFFRLIKQPENDFIVGSDFAPYLEELLAYHPGLEFLENTPEFQEKYARTVVARILYQVNTSLNGKITRRELRQSDLLEVCHQVDEEEDINLVHRYFSYEHFYCIYVKFWELDTDHDFLLSKDDLMRHGGHSLTPGIVNRIFQQPVYPFMSGVPDRMGFEDFVFFFISEEDKTSPVSLRYWFKCVDLDGDGVIRSWEMKYFYDQQLARLQSYGHEVISFADVICQAHDFVSPQTEGALVLADFLNPACRNISGMLFNILFNLNKFIAFEQRDPYWIRQQHEHPELTEWDRYAGNEYSRLASAEEEREMEEEHFGHSDFGGSGDRQHSWLQYNESPF